MDKLFKRVKVLLNFANFYARRYIKPVGPWQHFPEAPPAPASEPFDAPNPDADPEADAPHPEAEPLPDGTQTTYPGILADVPSYHDT